MNRKTVFKIRDLFGCIRIKHWIKNSFIFAPLLFSGRLRHPADLFAVIKCFLYFSLISSAAYIINDLSDVESDRLHPIKSQRPIAQNRVYRPAALALCFLFLVLGFLGIIKMGIAGILFTAFFYILLNIAYSIFLKHMAVLDVVSIALSFELRVWAGAVTIGIAPSGWLQVCTFLLALFLGFAKRREEILLLKSAASRHRRALTNYSMILLNQMIVISSATTILAYILYTLSLNHPDSPRAGYLIYSIPFVIYGVFRYLHLVYAHKKGGDPVDIVLYDKQLLTDLVLWGAAIFFILYL